MQSLAFRSSSPLGLAQDVNAGPSNSFAPHVEQVRQHNLDQDVTVQTTLSSEPKKEKDHWEWLNKVSALCSKQRTKTM